MNKWNARCPQVKTLDRGILLRLFYVHSGQDLDPYLRSEDQPVNRNVLEAVLRQLRIQKHMQFIRISRRELVIDLKQVLKRHRFSIVSCF